MEVVSSLYPAIFLRIRFEMWLSELDISAYVKQFIMQKYITYPKITSTIMNARFKASPVLEVLDAPYCTSSIMFDWHYFWFVSYYVDKNKNIIIIIATYNSKSTIWLLGKHEVKKGW